MSERYFGQLMQRAAISASIRDPKAQAIIRDDPRDRHRSSIEARWWPLYSDDPALD